MTRVLVVDDAPAVISNVERLLSRQTDMEACGTAQDGEAALAKARALLPDVVVMEANLPVMDGVRAAELIHRELASIRVILTGTDDPSRGDILAQHSGAVAYLPKPFSGLELLEAIRSDPPPPPPPPVALPPVDTPRAEERRESQRRRGGVIAVVGAKGGVGKSLIAVNLAILIARDSNKRVALIDLALHGGDVALLTRMESNFSVLDALARPQALPDHVVEGPSGLAVLLAPSSPIPGAKAAEQGGPLRDLLTSAGRIYDVIIVDTDAHYTPETSAAIDCSDNVILVTSMSDPSVKAAQKLLPDIDRRVGADGVWIALNRPEANSDFNRASVEETLGREVAAQLPYDIMIPPTVNRGTPLVLANPNSQSARVLRTLASRIVNLPTLPDDDEPMRGNDDDRSFSPEPKRARRGLFTFNRS